MRTVEDLVGDFYEAAWNRWDDAIVEDILGPGFAFRGSLGDEVLGRDGWRGYRDQVRAGIPDLHNEVLDLVVCGDRAAARLRYTGHHRGLLLGVSGSGGAIEYAGAAFFTAAEGMLTSAWVLGDLDSLRRQLG